MNAPSQEIDNFDSTKQDNPWTTKKSSKSRNSTPIFENDRKSSFSPFLEEKVKHFKFHFFYFPEVFF